MITVRTCLRWLAVLIVCALPALAQADTFQFRNDTKSSVIVHVATVQRGVLKREQGMLKSGESTTKQPFNADKVITIYDCKTNRILYRDSLRMSKTPLNFSIIPDPRKPGQVALRPITTATDGKAESPPSKSGTKTPPSKSPPKRDR